MKYSIPQKVFFKRGHENYGKILLAEAKKQIIGNDINIAGFVIALCLK